MEEQSNKKIKKDSQPKPQPKGGGGMCFFEPIPLYDSSATTGPEVQYMDIINLSGLIDYYANFQSVILNPDGNALTVGTSNFDQSLIDQVIDWWCSLNSLNQEVCDTFEEEDGEWPIWEPGMSPGDIFPTAGTPNYPWENPTTLTQYHFYQSIDLDQNAMLDNFCNWCWEENPFTTTGITPYSPGNPLFDLNIPGLIGMGTMFSGACMCCDSSQYSNMPIYGCMDSDYVEYYSQGFIANTDDGSCETIAIFGCTDPEAENYDDETNVDDDSCYYEADEPKDTDMIYIYCYTCKSGMPIGKKVLVSGIVNFDEEPEGCPEGWTENEEEACPEETYLTCYQCQIPEDTEEETFNWTDGSVIAQQFPEWEYKACPVGWTEDEDACNPAGHGKRICYTCDDSGNPVGMNYDLEECPPGWTEYEDAACLEGITYDGDKDVDFFEIWEDEEINFGPQEYVCSWCPRDFGWGTSGYYYLISPNYTTLGTNPSGYPVGWKPDIGMDFNGDGVNDEFDGVPPVPVPYKVGAGSTGNITMNSLKTPSSVGSNCRRFAPPGPQYIQWDDPDQGFQDSVTGGGIDYDPDTGPNEELNQFCHGLGYPVIDEDTIGVNNSDFTPITDEPYTGEINCIYCPGQQVHPPGLEQAMWDFQGGEGDSLGPVDSFDYTGFLNLGITNNFDMWTDSTAGLSEYYIMNFFEPDYGISQYGYSYGDVWDWVGSGFGLFGDPGEVTDNTQSTWTVMPGSEYMRQLFNGYWYPESWTQGGGKGWDVEVDGPFPVGMEVEGNPIANLTQENCWNFVPNANTGGNDGYGFDQFNWWHNDTTIGPICNQFGFNDLLATQQLGITEENLSGIPTITEGDCPWRAACNWGDPCPEGYEDECVNNCYWGCDSTQQSLGAVVGLYGYGPCADFITTGTNSTICCENCAVNEGECIIDTFNDAWSDIIVEQVIGDSYDALCNYGPDAVYATQQYAGYINQILNTAQQGLTFIPGVTTNAAVVGGNAATVIGSVQEYTQMAENFATNIINNPVFNTWEQLCAGEFNITDFMASFLPQGADITVMSDNQGSILYNMTGGSEAGGIADNFVLDLVDSMDGITDGNYTVNLGPATMWQVVESIVCYMDASWWDQSNSFPGNTGWFHDCCGNVPGAETTEGNDYQNSYDQMWNMCIPGNIEIAFLSWVANHGYDPQYLTLADAEAGNWMENHPYYTYGGNHPTYLNNVFGNTLGQSYTTDWGPFGGPGGWCLNGGAPDQYNPMMISESTKNL